MAIRGHAADLPHDPVVWQFLWPCGVHFELWCVLDFGGPGAGDDEQTNSQDNAKHEGGRSWRNFVYAQSLLLSKGFGKADWLQAMQEEDNAETQRTQRNRRAEGPECTRGDSMLQLAAGEFCTIVHRFAQVFDQNLIDGENGKDYFAFQIEPVRFRNLRVNLK